MTPEELFAVLDIAPDTLPGALGDPDDSGDQPSAPAIPASPTALKLDAWSMRRGAEAAGGDILRPILAGQDQETAEHAAADFLGAAFEPAPVLADYCADETRGRYMRQLMETEEYRALHADTAMDAVASEIAAGHFAQGFIALQNQEAKETPPDTPGSTPGDREGENFKADIRALGAASKALEKASKDVDDLRDAQRALGGDGPAPGSKCDPATLKARFERIRNSRQLRRIMELAGRYRRLAQAKQRQKTLHGRDDVVGVELGNDLARLCSSELAALADEDLELDALRRYLERGLMQRDYRGVEAKGRGPIVVIVDESGSMNGEPIAMAKAFALAMAWVARHQRRWIALVGFSGCCPVNVLAMPPDKWDQGKTLDWLEHFYSGGSSRDVPLVELPEAWPALHCPAGQTDVIQITDACCDIPPQIARDFIAWKERTQAKYYTIVIGNDDPGDLRAVSDRVWALPDLSLDHDAISELMSL